MSNNLPTGPPPDRDAGAVLRADRLAPRHARATVRRALTAWGLDSITTDAQLLASELVANAVEHAEGAPIRLIVREQPAHDGQRGIICQITDTAPTMPKPRHAQPDSERGRGLWIVAALATDSGVTRHAHGKTAWFTLTSPELAFDSLEADYEAEASA
ncbi:MAG TPA: ATP-binding protein [Streptosporangiaceae bacterium]|nr:ATP-binding protein [Streptosporangiaceae bacterium]